MNQNTPKRVMRKTSENTIEVKLQGNFHGDESAWNGRVNYPNSLNKFFHNDADDLPHMSSTFSFAGYFPVSYPFSYFAMLSSKSSCGIIFSKTPFSKSLQGNSYLIDIDQHLDGSGACGNISILCFVPLISCLIVAGLFGFLVGLWYTHLRLQRSEIIGPVQNIKEAVKPTEPSIDIHDKSIVMSDNTSTGMVAAPLNPRTVLISQVETASVMKSSNSIVSSSSFSTPPRSRENSAQKSSSVYVAAKPRTHAPIELPQLDLSPLVSSPTSPQSGDSIWIPTINGISPPSSKSIKREKDIVNSSGLTNLSPVRTAKSVGRLLGLTKKMAPSEQQDQ